MSYLSEKQYWFAPRIARLITAADARGIRLRFGHAWRDPRVYKIVAWAFANGYDDGLPPPKSHPRSNHYNRLAVDLIAEAESAHAVLHPLWETLGGAAVIEGDANHYSVEWDGMR